MNDRLKELKKDDYWIMIIHIYLSRLLDWTIVLLLFNHQCRFAMLYNIGISNTQFKKKMLKDRGQVLI